MNGNVSRGGADKKRLKSPSSKTRKPLPADCREFKQLRWGILYDRCAAISKHFLLALKSCPRSQLVAIACPDTDRVQPIADELEVEKVYGCYDDLLEDKAIDGVYIAVSNSLHAELAKKTVKGGKHCLVEKPLATKVSDVIELEQLAKEANVIIAEGYAHLYHPQYHAIKQEIKSGCIGDVSHMYGNFDLHAKNNNNNNNKSVIDRKGADSDIGAIWNIGCYPVSMMVGIVGKCPLKVSAVKQKGQRGEDVKMIGWMNFDENVIGSISASITCPTNTYFEIVGTKGRMRLHKDWCFHPDSWNTTNSFELVMEGQPSKEVTVLCQNVFRSEILSFEASVLDGKRAVVPLTLSKDIVATVEALCTSADSDGIPVRPYIVNSTKDT
ncbi:trans-1,2-dihydrobenzene-1,2-diol dehydrogenase-like [Ptychodera flava]|uniref:trans-1,2-dihydrobenzene-1,2-diol dehydrogenase-like n=1 Tax=Ptychodera flava TaxID=63121 RepID=UPI00396A287A